MVHSKILAKIQARPPSCGDSQPGQQDLDNVVSKLATLPPKIHGDDVGQATLENHARNHLSRHGYAPDSQQSRLRVA